MNFSWIWIPATLIAAAAQTARNAAQRELVGAAGPFGAASVRFLYGAPFGALFLQIFCIISGSAPNALTLKGAAWIAAASLAQIAATGLMLAAMRSRSFFATIALTKTEPLQVAAFGLAFLGERLSFVAVTAILLSTAGVAILSLPPGLFQRRSTDRTIHAPGAPERTAGGRAIALGLGAASCFAISAIGFRAGILEFNGPTFLIAAAAALAASLLFQAALILALMILFDRPLLRAIAAQWRPSLFAGFIGAFASLFWFVAFAVQSAAPVRTLGLVEVVFARIVSRQIFKEGASKAELLGAGLILCGVALLLNG
ncbi:DMT superfamily permease [Methylocella silvestris BL2]|uniref:DMT superfamily permease n=1 Tax=Methylocella silvestris (strain DSM 15510 / CIP 108128 / LMG 27833 / NCIMB 13906 / BL2) TaxID=395965 RepID=B8EQE5_METSB|nr:EamA family transporter [Methylocella silvestris]ACK52158.1 DMT superfamily permease [Methylocella silvestris BL2]